ncbi:MAG: type III pantothenate kinase [Lachnospiraceae bacterium]
MILAIDIGNTNIVIGCIDSEKIYFVERLSTNLTKTDLEYAIDFKNIIELNHIHPTDIKGSIISSVVPPISNTVLRSVEKILNSTPMLIGPGIKTGLNIVIDTPSQLGSDLVVDAVAAIANYPLPLIIIDMGTATTLSVVDSKRNYIGGVILPGVKVASESLSNHTSQLPKISLEAPKKVIGRNTIDSMKSGAVLGNASMLDGMIDRIEEELGEKATYVATGGLSKFVIPHCKHQIYYDDALLLKGLWIIYSKNM